MYENCLENGEMKTMLRVLQTLMLAHVMSLIYINDMPEKVHKYVCR